MTAALTYVPDQTRAPRMPLLRATRGQQRLLVSRVRISPQVNISTGQNLDYCPIFKLAMRNQAVLVRPLPGRVRRHV